MKVFKNFGKALRRLFGGNERQDGGEVGRGVSAARETVRDNADNDDEFEEPLAGHYNAWDEVDDVRSNFFLGGWATRRIREFNASRKQRDCEELEKRQQAEQEGREYRSPLQLELEDVARKREEKERLKEAGRAKKEAAKRGKRNNGGIT